MRRRSEPLRLLVQAGLLGASAAWGVVELFALQRSRYHAWRVQRQPATPR